MSIFQALTYAATQKYGKPGGTTPLVAALPSPPPIAKTVMEYMGAYSRVNVLGERSPQQQTQWGARAKTTQVGTRYPDILKGTPLGAAAQSVYSGGQAVYRFAFGRGR